ncbi:MAG TPA: hypothetical protein VFW98_07855 [Gemmatimonadaceae bacterium]|nr:hypothetical protein [Gemmatimonadaceae bacterium]
MKSFALRLPIAVLALSVAAAAPASAQLGHLLKKAKQSASGGSPGDASAPPHFDASTVELVPARVAGVLKGLHAQARVLAGSNGHSVASLNAQRDAAAKSLDASRAAHATAREQYDRLVDQRNECRTSVGNQREQQREKTNTSSGGSDAAMQAMVAKYKQEIMAAMQQGDMQKVQALTQEMQKKMMQTAGTAAAAESAAQDSTARADSLAVDKQCGPAPTPPPFIAEQDSLQAQLEKLDTDIRTVQQQAELAASTASALSQLQYAVALERITTCLRGSREAFSKAELNALDAQQQELKQALASIQ